MALGAIDLGTNSCRLLIAEKQGEKLAVLYRDLKTTRLGENLLKTGRIGGNAVERTCEALNAFKEALAKYGVKRYRAIGTSAIREAKNREEVLRSIFSRCGIEVEVISGEEEAYLSYLGVEKGLNFKMPPLVVDLGGGSTEFILGQDFKISLPLGAVRATEADVDVQTMKGILKPLADSGIDFRPHPLVFAGGTATTLAALKMKLKDYSPSLVHGQVLKYEDILGLYNLLTSLALEERKKLPGLQPERADIIPKGVLAVLAIMEVLEKEEITVSEADLMEGMIWQMLIS